MTSPSSVATPNPTDNSAIKRGVSLAVLLISLIPRHLDTFVSILRLLKSATPPCVYSLRALDSRSQYRTCYDENSPCHPSRRVWASYSINHYSLPSLSYSCNSPAHPARPDSSARRLFTLRGRPFP